MRVNIQAVGKTYKQTLKNVRSKKNKWTVEWELYKGLYVLMEEHMLS